MRRVQGDWRSTCASDAGWRSANGLKQALAREPLGVRRLCQGRLLEEGQRNLWPIRYQRLGEALARHGSRVGRPTTSRSSSSSMKLSAWRRSSSEIIGGWLRIVETTETRTPLRCRLRPAGGNRRRLKRSRCDRHAAQAPSHRRPVRCPCCP